jgi:hypothetical protein
MKKIKPEAGLNANVSAELVRADSESSRALLEARDRKGTIAEIRSGLHSLRRRQGKPATEFFREFFAEEGITKDEC